MLLYGTCVYLQGGYAKGKDDILMLMQALDKEQSSQANNARGDRKSALHPLLLKELVRPGAWRCLGGAAMPSFLLDASWNWQLASSLEIPKPVY